jgi:hypothetical protein
MTTLQDTVQALINDWVRQGVLFTALDVSNEAKKSFPFARHREVRDIVRAAFADMQLQGYGRTPIPVSLPNGDQVEALLYHPLTDSWDLDVKYDAQKRAQTAATPLASIAVHSSSANTVTVSNDVGVSTAYVQLPAPAAVSAPISSPTDPNKMWDDLFDGIDLFHIL